MANNIKNWNVDPDKNDKESPYGWKEDMAPSDVNNTARQEMADLKDAYVSQPWFSVGEPTITITSSATYAVIRDDDADTNYAKYFPQSRSVRIAETASSAKYKMLVQSASYDAESGESRINLYGWDASQFGSQANLAAFLLEGGTYSYMEIGLEPDVMPGGPSLLGCVLPYTANPSQLQFGFGLADGTTFNPDLYVDLATLYLKSGTVGSASATYIHGQEYNAAAGKNWPKKPDVRGLYPKFSSSTSSSASISQTFTGNHARTSDVTANEPLAKTSDQIQNITGTFGGTGRYSDKWNPSGVFYLTGKKSWNNGDDWDGSPEVGFDASKVVRTGSTTEVAAMNMPGILVMIGGYGKAGTLTPEQLAEIVIKEAKEYVDSLPGNNPATTTSPGIVLLATESDATSATGNSKAMTPAMTKLAIETFAGEAPIIAELEADIQNLQQTKASNESVAQITRELNDAVNEINEIIVEMDDIYTKEEVNALIGGGTATKSYSVTVTTQSWNASTKSVALMDYPDVQDIVWVSPAGTKENIEAYAAAGCFANRDSVTAKLVLYCEEIPTVDIVVEVVKMDIV